MAAYRGYLNWMYVLQRQGVRHLNINRRHSYNLKTRTTYVMLARPSTTSLTCTHSPNLMRELIWNLKLERHSRSKQVLDYLAARSLSLSLSLSLSQALPVSPFRSFSLFISESHSRSLCLFFANTSIFCARKQCLLSRNLEAQKEKNRDSWKSAATCASGHALKLSPVVMSIFF